MMTSRFNIFTGNNFCGGAYFTRSTLKIGVQHGCQKQKSGLLAAFLIDIYRFRSRNFLTVLSMAT